MTPQVLVQIATAAVASERATGLPDVLSAAQCALESAWLAKAPGNNCFGIKTYKNSSGRQLLETSEWFTSEQLQAFLALGDGRAATPTGQVNGALSKYRVKDWFATFVDLAECFNKHALLITTGKAYASAWNKYLTDRNVDVLIHEIAPIYATDPGYEESIKKIIAMKSLQQALTTARAT
jgi:flagellum-specific peptidoglycan hydrolase FlgJ